MAADKSLRVVMLGASGTASSCLTRLRKVATRCVGLHGSLRLWVR
jgi:hypothetical protein